MWLGHVARMGDDRRAKQVIKWVPEGKMGRLRPRKNWPETTREDLKGLHLTQKDALNAARDRYGWRKMHCPTCSFAWEGLRSKVRSHSSTTVIKRCLQINAILIWSINALTMIFIISQQLIVNSHWCTAINAYKAPRFDQECIYYNTNSDKTV